MAQPTYSLRALVLRRTKLGESDLILTLLSEDGSQKRAVAKGARRPKSSFAARTEPFCVIDALCATGRSLDILKEARLVAAHDALRCNLEASAAAAPVAGLAAGQIGVDVIDGHGQAGRHARHDGRKIRPVMYSIDAAFSQGAPTEGARDRSAPIVAHAEAPDRFGTVKCGRKRPLSPLRTRRCPPCAGAG